jgi:hypothetical protein
VRALLAALLLAAPAAALADYDPFEDQPPGDERRRLSVTAWGGELLGLTRSGRQDAAHVGGEVAWSFDALDVGVLGQAARLHTGTSDWSPMALLRLTERFETRQGVDATFTLGVGAAREETWKAWFQVALGVRVDLGPLFLAGELGSEQGDLFRLAAGLGARF